VGSTADAPHMTALRRSLGAHVGCRVRSRCSMCSRWSRSSMIPAELVSGLVAWELCVDEELVAPAWRQAISHGLMTPRGSSRQARAAVVGSVLPASSGRPKRARQLLSRRLDGQEPHAGWRSCDDVGSEKSSRSSARRWTKVRGADLELLTSFGSFSRGGSDRRARAGTKRGSADQAAAYALAEHWRAGSQCAPHDAGLRSVGAQNGAKSVVVAVVARASG
jgi:hypothetical protein